MSDHSFLLAAFVFSLSLCNLELVKHSLGNKTWDCHHQKRANKHPLVWPGSVSHLEVWGCEWPIQSVPSWHCLMSFSMNTKPTAALRRAHYLSMILDSLKNERGLWSLGPLWASVSISSWSCVLLNSCNTQTNPQVKSKITACLHFVERRLSKQQLPGYCRYPRHWGTAHVLRWDCSPVTKQCVWADLSYWNCTEVSRCNTKNKTWLCLYSNPCWQLCQPMIAPLYSPIDNALLGKCSGECVILAKLHSQWCGFFSWWRKVFLCLHKI